MNEEEQTGTPPLLAGEEQQAGENLPRWRWGVALALLVFYVLGIGLLGVGQQRAASTMASGNDAALLPTTIGGLLRLSAGELIFFGGVFGIALVFSRMRKGDLLLQWKDGLRPILRGFGWSLFLRGAIAVLVTVVALGIAGTSKDPQKSMEGLRPKTEAIVNATALTDPVYLLLAMTLVSFVVAGLREELWRVGVMRCLAGLFPEHFSSRAGQVRAVAVAAVIFGLGHLPQGWSGAFITSVLGLGLGLLILRYRCIWDAVLAHGFFNATTFLALYWIAKNHPGMLP